jgi:cytidylate kinase
VFDKNLVSRVLQDHHLPERLAQFMPEDKVSGISDAVEELLGLHPAAWKLVHQSAETILSLAELGSAIFVGRGAAAILGHLPQVFHVRLVGSLEKRIERVKEHYRVDTRAAREFIKKEDAARKRYLKRYFKRDIDDPLLYHLTLNTDLIACDDAAAIVAEIILQRYT